MKQIMKMEKPDFFQIYFSIVTRNAEAGPLPDMTMREQMVSFFDPLGGTR